MPGVDAFCHDRPRDYKINREALYKINILAKRYKMSESEVINLLIDWGLQSVESTAPLRGKLFQPHGKF
jgi:hypothetical protein